MGSAVIHPPFGQPTVTGVVTFGDVQRKHISHSARPDPLRSLRPPQSVLLLFMRPGSVLFEVTRQGSPGYGELAKAVGLRYASATSKLPSQGLLMRLFSMKRCMRVYLCRSYVQRADVELSENDLEVLIALILEGSRSGR